MMSEIFSSDPKTHLFSHNPQKVTSPKKRYILGYTTLPSPLPPTAAKKIGNAHLVIFKAFDHYKK